MSSRDSRAKVQGRNSVGAQHPLKSVSVLNSASIFDRSADSRRADTESPINGEAVDPANRVGLVVRNLPLRSTDSSIKDGLFFTYKRLGRVLSVKVIGESADRYGIVTFRK